MTDSVPGWVVVSSVVLFLLVVGVAAWMMTGLANDSSDWPDEEPFEEFT